LRIANRPRDVTCALLTVTGAEVGENLEEAGVSQQIEVWAPLLEYALAGDTDA
jgi:hypothetical protein